LDFFGPGSPGMLLTWRKRPKESMEADRVDESIRAAITPERYWPTGPCWLAEESMFSAV